MAIKRTIDILSLMYINDLMLDMKAEEVSIHIKLRT